MYLNIHFFIEQYFILRLKFKTFIYLLIRYMHYITKLLYLQIVIIDYNIFNF